MKENELLESLSKMNLCVMEWLICIIAYVNEIMKNYSHNQPSRSY